MMKIRRSMTLSALIALAAILVLGRCSKQESEGPFTKIYNNTLSRKCVDCHNPSGQATLNYNVQLNFTLNSAAYQTLLAGGVQGATSTGTCGSVRIVAAGSPSTSYLLSQVVPSYYSTNFGGVSGCTPYSGHQVNLSQSEQDELVSWIQNGAQND